jgi:hypothetical protein
MAVSFSKKIESEGQYQITLSSSFIHAFVCNDISIRHSFPVYLS